MSELKEYRCTRNALYSHDCTGRDDIRERQGHYIMACSADEAWEKMAIRYPEEAAEGFTVQEWQGFNVRVFKVDRDSEGNIVESDCRSRDDKRVRSQLDKLFRS